MDVITVNVGQGALTIVRNKSEAIVIDARMPPADDDTVASVKRHLARFLASHYLRGVILTGLDLDHCDVRCLAILLRKYRPDWVLLPDYSKDTECCGEVIDLLDSEVANRSSGSAPLRVLPTTTSSTTAGELVSLSPNFSFEIFSPISSGSADSNNSSLVIKITGTGSEGFSYLVTGDTENERWKAINTEAGNRLASDVMAAPHHGARDANNAATLLLVSPNTVLVSAGIDNQYGHPDPAVLRAYTRVAKHVFATCADNGCSLYTSRHNGDFRTIAFTD